MCETAKTAKKREWLLYSFSCTIKDCYLFQKYQNQLPKTIQHGLKQFPPLSAIHVEAPSYRSNNRRPITRTTPPIEHAARSRLLPYNWVDDQMRSDSPHPTPKPSTLRRHIIPSFPPHFHTPCLFHSSHVGKVA